MADEVNEDNLPLETPREPLFNLDLGANGGLFAPTTIQEAIDWLQREAQLWSWIQSVSVAGNHRASLDQALQPLVEAASAARQALQYANQGNDPAAQEMLAHVQRNTQGAFTSRKWPHSSTPLAKAVETLRVEDPLTAVAYMYVMVPNTQGYQFDAKDIASWRGFVLGLTERFDISKRGEPEVAAQRAALDDLRANFSGFVGTKKKAVERLHRDFVKTAGEIEAAKSSQKSEFDSMMDASKDAHEQALKKHEGDMETLRKTFREAMTLRGPVEYWKTKATGHETKSALLMKVMFGSMAALGALIGLLAVWVFSTLTKEGTPEAWKVAVLVLVGVVGVWAIRLVVRMFLSHTHLATDADERVTMVMTYLALLEGEKMPSDDDRKLVLAPLFRPATDGIVKDEGLPHPLLELLTRAGQK